MRVKPFIFITFSLFTLLKFNNFNITLKIQIIHIIVLYNSYIVYTCLANNICYFHMLFFTYRYCHFTFYVYIYMYILIIRIFLWIMYCIILYLSIVSRALLKYFTRYLYLYNNCSVILLVHIGNYTKENFILFSYCIFIYNHIYV